MNRAMTSLYLKLQAWKESRRDTAPRLIRDERGGAEIIAAIILLAVVVLLAVIFREKIEGLLGTIWNGVDEKAGKLGGDLVPKTT